MTRRTVPKGALKAISRRYDRFPIRHDEKVELLGIVYTSPKDGKVYLHGKPIPRDPSEGQINWVHNAAWSLYQKAQKVAEEHRRLLREHPLAAVGGDTLRDWRRMQYRGLLNEADIKALDGEIMRRSQAYGLEYVTDEALDDLV